MMDDDDDDALIVVVVIITVLVDKLLGCFLFKILKLLLKNK